MSEVINLIANSEWDELYRIAKGNVNHTKISPYVTIGFVSSTIKSKTGKIYTGVCVDACCGLGICAERNALTTMLAAGDFQIDKIVTVDENFKICPPCGACRELLAQILPEKDVKIAVAGDEKEITVMTLKKLIPESWV